MPDKNDVNPIAKQFKSASNQFFFNLAVEQFRPRIIKEFRKWLKPMTTEIVKEMIKNGTFPKLDPKWFDNISGYRTYILNTKFSQLLEYIGDAATPEIVQAIMEEGVEGRLWLRKLYVYLLECVDHPEKLIPEVPKIEAPEDKMVTVQCQSCSKAWPSKMSEVESIEKCPFCGTSTKEPAPAPVNKPEEVKPQNA
jgi:hypothetical protein